MEVMTAAAAVGKCQQTRVHVTRAGVCPSVPVSLSFSLFRDDDRLFSLSCPVLSTFFGFSLSFQSDAGLVFTSRFRKYLCFLSLSLSLFTGSPLFLLLSRIMLSLSPHF